MVSRRALAWGLAAVASLGIVAQPARATVVVGNSMAPTYADGSLLWTKPVDRPLLRGDVVVVDTPSGPVLKRVALIAGDRRLQWRSANRWVDMTTFIPPSRAKNYRHIRSVDVPRGTVFLLGDNLDVSIDSRSFGPVPVGYVRRLVIDQRTPAAHSCVAGEAARGWLAMARGSLLDQPTNL